MNFFTRNDRAIRSRLRQDDQVEIATDYPNGVRTIGPAGAARATQCAANGSCAIVSREASRGGGK